MKFPDDKKPLRELDEDIVRYIEDLVEKHKPYNLDNDSGEKLLNLQRISWCKLFNCKKFMPLVVYRTYTWDSQNKEIHLLQTMVDITTTTFQQFRAQYCNFSQYANGEKSHGIIIMPCNVSYIPPVGSFIQKAYRYQHNLSNTKPVLPTENPL